MSNIFVLILLTTGSCVVFANIDTFGNNHVAEMEMNSLKFKPIKHQSAVGVTGFKWESCDKNAVVQVTDLKITPDPLKFPGTVTVGMNLKASKEVGGTLQADVKVRMSGIEIPCIGGTYGSCTYNDVCNLIQPLANICPASFKAAGFNCVCPFAANTYNLPATSFPVNIETVPSGDYSATVKVTQGSTSIMCLNVDLSIA